MNATKHCLKFKFFLGVLCFVLTIFSSCKKESKYLNTTYYGAWYETWFDYTFKPNGTFVFKTKGHYGGTTTKGKYRIIDSIILIHPYTDWNLFQGVLQNRLVLTKDNSCLYDVKKNYYCMDEEEKYERRKKHQGILDTIINKLSNFEEVQEVFNTYLTPETYEEHKYYPKFEFERIVWVNKRLYYSIKLRRRDPEFDYDYKYIADQSYLIDYKRNKIYKHRFFDELIYIGKIY